ncbi:N(1)-aminopropylagmatine ureohydrolase [Pseudodesulfovibrio hydrargyri]|uniref:N(1)-aminopropylagmatine ureohydrolase n=1 Tax=Pseudodesulfovibrio hydrargyri TaxID=2125990 RepID=A0A1J5MY50_9BACT|nr:agmatinase [Pseudodesulfovibrio hydrargyri]OIQ50930.1 N(1)-aminopropylagmatine ureohydrolase [Pseudodesulfovibrio hydrargyri]
MRLIPILGVPLDHNSSYLRGSARGPFSLVGALHCDSANLWTETGFDLGPVLDHRGALELGEPEAAFQVIEEAAAQVGNDRPIFLGGDHSVTYPLVRGLKRTVGDFAILHFDAHPDCYHEFEGNPHSHACPFARIMEEGLCTRLVSVGIRTAHGHQRKQREKFGIQWLEMKDRAHWPVLSFDVPVYVSVDLDALDPAFAPGVSHHEPGGMSTRELLDVLHAVDAPIIGADIVELNPDRDLNGVTAMVGAKILREIAGMMISA